MADSLPGTLRDGTDHSPPDGRARPHDDSLPFRGVRRRSWGRYVSEIRLPGKKTRVWLGSFVSAEMAARAYDSAALFLRGSSACLNFPELAESLPRPVSASRRDIQRAAAKAAGLAAGGPRKDAERAASGEKEASSVVWEMEEELVSCLSEARDAPLHSPPRIEWFLPQGGVEMDSYENAFYSDDVGFCAWSYNL